MRFLSFHVDYFWYKVTKRGRSKVFEELSGRPRENRIENAIVFFLSIEKQDETNAQVIEKCLNEIKKMMTQLKVSNLVLVPFAHLFGELSSPEFALNTLQKLSSKLNEMGYSVLRLPFGWFHELELKAKGHPLSRISRIIH
ncbi:MAG: threonyl-tRNA synthetase editing domain-containing protein [Candidatus Helarchaeota archaeon]